jgi:hypothetical protein
MNTKQLWHALSSNYYTQNYFDGVYSLDTLKDIKEIPRLIICNTDPSEKPGEHWILFYFQNKCVEFYDSLGNELESYGSEFVHFIKNFVNNYKESNRRTQPLDTSVCGEYCLYYALNRCKGYDMNIILNSMNNESVVTDFVHKNYLLCHNNRCNFLQSCCKL